MLDIVVRFDVTRACYHYYLYFIIIIIIIILKLFIWILSIAWLKIYTITQIIRFAEPNSLRHSAEHQYKFRPVQPPNKAGIHH